MKPIDSSKLIGCDFSEGWVNVSVNQAMDAFLKACPYGQVGDKLWVRETWWVTGTPFGNLKTGKGCHVEYKADNKEGLQGIWRPSIFMPRWTSRITLEITDIRVQRLQEISEEDAFAEGIENLGNDGQYHASRHDTKLGAYFNYHTAKEAYANLWDSINGKTHPWSKNDWVWAITFTRLEGK